MNRDEFFRQLKQFGFSGDVQLALLDYAMNETREERLGAVAALLKEYEHILTDEEQISYEHILNRVSFFKRAKTIQDAGATKSYRTFGKQIAEHSDKKGIAQILKSLVRF